MAFTEAKDIVVSIGNQQITGKGAYCKEMNITQNLDGPTEINLRLVCAGENLIMEMWDDNFKPKIRNKKVEDCSIQELLFAVRSKIGERK